MFKHIAILFFAILLATTSLPALARSKSKSKKHHKSNKHARKSRRYHHGTGPDLKSITTDSPYKEDPTNGINPIETKQPEQ